MWPALKGAQQHPNLQTYIICTPSSAHQHGSSAQIVTSIVSPWEASSETLMFLTVNTIYSCLEAKT